MEVEKYQYLGPKTFLIFTLRKSLLFFIFLVLSILLFSISFVFEGNFSSALKQLGSAIMLLAAVFLIFTLFYVWLEYRNFRFMISVNAFKVKKGIIQKEEIAIPYRQIQSVNIKRTIFDQIFRVSKLIILTAGEEDKEEKIKGESEAILPVIDKKLALKIQEELLKRTNIEQVPIR